MSELWRRVQKEKIKENREKKEQAEREKITRPYNEVIKKTIQETK